MNLNTLKSIGIGNLFFSLPTASISIDLMKQDTDAQTLANPKIRVINNKPAKIHIGDRVPIKISTITEATGQTRNIYEYKDVGVKLSVEPNIHLGNNITIKMGLEISSLGNNVGSPTDPQYVIGSRNTETMLNLKDGEAVIIGGLIKDEERNTVDKIPLLGDIPILGKLFSKTDKGTIKTDILMTITPRIIRNLEIPDKELQAFWSGTEENYSTKQIFAGIPTSVDIKETEAPQPASVSPTAAPKQTPLPTPQASPPSVVQQPPAEAEKALVQVSLRPSELNLQINQEIKMDVMVSGVKNLSDIFLTITYDPKIIDFKRVAEGNFLNSDNWATSFISSVNTKSGIIDIHLNRIADILGASGTDILFTLTFQGKSPGSSPILFGNNQFINPKREAISVELKGGTVNVQ
jgi:general secretion pathway protein D